jgi:hypothetical protein
MGTVRVTTFVVRVTHDPAGGLSGIVERVSDGLKERLSGDLEAVGAIIGRLLPPLAPPDPSARPRADNAGLDAAPGPAVPPCGHGSETHTKEART